MEDTATTLPKLTFQYTIIRANGEQEVHDGEAEMTPEFTEQLREAIAKHEEQIFFSFLDPTPASV
jgi:hypothetical protein